MARKQAGGRVKDEKQEPKRKRSPAAPKRGSASGSSKRKSAAAPRERKTARAGSRSPSPLPAGREGAPARRTPSAGKRSRASQAAPGGRSVARRPARRTARRPRFAAQRAPEITVRRRRSLAIVARAPVTAPATPVTARDVEPARLHPAFRSRIAKVLAQLDAEGIPFRIFEGYRTPERQRWLWEQGRSRPGAIVTKAQPWESYHQYGLASDLVLFVNGQWSWDTSGPRAAWWKRMKALGRANGLEALSFEMPHLQIAGTSIAELRGGAYPAGGDDAWADTLASAVYRWAGTPAAPTAPTQVAERPPLPPEALAAAVPASTPAAKPVSTGPVAHVAASDWHARFNGQRWRADASGVYTKGFDDGRTPMRTDGQPVTMRRIWALLGDAILAASRKHGIPPALVMMVIATETASYRNYGFTGPFTFRWEPGVKVNDVTPNLFGDYSVGPMQILATTARWVIGTQRLDYDAFKTAPVFERRPEPPQSLPLYDAAANIDVGAAVIKQRWAQSGDDPILVAASYNAGGVYSSDDNPWRIRCYGNHLDRAAQWYGDACFVLKEAGAVARARAFVPGRVRASEPRAKPTASRPAFRGASALEGIRPAKGTAPARPG